MKKTILLALVIMSASLANAQILYKISGNGLKKSSYVVGTHHFVDESFVNQIPGMQKVLKETKQVYGEVVMTDMANPDTLQVLQQAMMLPEKTTIKDYLSPEHFEMLNSLFSGLVGIPFESPQIYGAMGSMRPSALMTQIQALVYLTEHPGSFDPNKGIDAFFQNQALKSKKKVGGLESVSFQTELLFNSQPIEDEVKSMICLLENFDVVRKQIDKITVAYSSQDAEMIVEAMKTKYGNSCDKLEEEGNAKLLTMRNENWLKQMPDIMKTNPTLFVVGAGHLLGDNGIIPLLRNAGYTVTPVTE